MNYFTSLWKNDTWDRKSKLCAAGHTALNYAAAESFSAGGVASGSTVFIVTVKNGAMYLGGLIKVYSVLDKKETADYLGQSEDELWSAKAYIVAERGSVLNFVENCEVPQSVAEKLQFVKRKGFTYLKFESPGKLDRQTLRNVRKLYPGSETALLSLLRR